MVSAADKKALKGIHQRSAKAHGGKSLGRKAELATLARNKARAARPTKAKPTAGQGQRGVPNKPAGGSMSQGSRRPTSQYPLAPGAMSQGPRPGGGAIGHNTRPIPGPTRPASGGLQGNGAGPVRPMPVISKAPGKLQGNGAGPVKPVKPKKRS